MEKQKDRFMKNKDFQATSRENFLIALLNKITKEYKTLLEKTRQVKPLKIVEIIHYSPVPGETKFAIQVTNKNCVIQLSAAESLNHRYHLDEFNAFHAEMIRQAAQGTLQNFLQIVNQEPKYKIVSKKFDKELKQHLFTIENKDQIRFTRTAEEISQNKELLFDFCKGD